jgi:hypothetical protein
VAIVPHIIFLSIGGKIKMVKINLNGICANDFLKLDYALDASIRGTDGEDEVEDDDVFDGIDAAKEISKDITLRINCVDGKKELSLILGEVKEDNFDKYDLELDTEFKSMREMCVLVEG